jgi:hypothetical protein
MTQIQLAERPSKRSLLPPAPMWPVSWLIVGFPFWWLMGLAVFIIPMMAAVMAVIMWRRRPIKLPPGFGLWVVFLVWSIGGVAVLNVYAPGTLPVSSSSRVLPFALRNLNYIAATIVMLYVGNMARGRQATRQVVRSLAILFVYTVCGGMLGLLAPHFSFTSPMERILPHSLVANDYVFGLVHPSAAQVQDVLGSGSAPRPEAPFEYTNTWGNNLSTLLPWFIIGWGLIGRRWQRLALPLVLAVAAVPIVYSLNRGLWIGLGASVAYIAWWALRRGRPLVPLVMLGTLVLGLALVAVSPLGGIISARLAHPHSNAIRGNLSQQAFDVAKSSPLIGYGSTRVALGSVQSIAVGRSANCNRCGNAPIGSNGQLWLLLIANGFVGAALYVSYFLYTLWAFRRDRTPIGVAGRLVIMLSFIYMIVYTAAISTLTIYFLSIALLWRSQQEANRSDDEDGDPDPTSDQGPAAAWPGTSAEVWPRVGGSR